jgi:hypothetical protein
MLALDCELDYQDCASLVNRISGVFELGHDFALEDSERKDK